MGIFTDILPISYLHVIHTFDTHLTEVYAEVSVKKSQAVPSDLPMTEIHSRAFHAEVLASMG